MPSTHADILKPLSGPSQPQLTLWIIKTQETGSLATSADPNLHSKDITYCQNYFKSTSVALFSDSCDLGSSCPPGRTMLFLKKQLGLYGRPGLDGCHPEQLPRVTHEGHISLIENWAHWLAVSQELSPVMGIEPISWSILVNKRLHPGIMNFT